MTRTPLVGAWSPHGPDDAAAELERFLREKNAAPLHEPTFAVSSVSSANAVWGDPSPVYRAEVRALLLTDPNPFPHMRLFGAR